VTLLFHEFVVLAFLYLSRQRRLKLADEVDLYKYTFIVYIYTNAVLNFPIAGSFTKKEGLQPVFLCRVRRIVKHGTVPGSSFEPNSP
jgi:hypothetical protein